MQTMSDHVCASAHGAFSWGREEQTKTVQSTETQAHKFKAAITYPH